MLNGSNRGCNFPSFLPSVPSEQIDVDSVPPRLILLVARSLTYVQYADYPPDYDSPPLSSDRLFNHSARVSPPAAFPSSPTPFHRSRFRIRRRWWVAIVHGHLDTRVVLVISLNIYIYSHSVKPAIVSLSQVRSRGSKTSSLAEKLGEKARRRGEGEEGGTYACSVS